MHFNPNDGKGVGRVVREVYGPDDFGPIYWVRYNPFHGYGPDDSPHYPYYTEAPDQGFVKAIDELLGNKLVVQQWYEEEAPSTSGGSSPATALRPTEPCGSPTPPTRRTSS
jgi:hypothetical protein